MATLPGRLKKVTYVGGHLELVVETEFGDMYVVSADVDAPYQPGEAVGVGFPPRGPVLITG
jgi:iron(III) transport system ATP-binding protein